MIVARCRITPLPLVMLPASPCVASVVSEADSERHSSAAGDTVSADCRCGEDAYRAFATFGTLPSAASVAGGTFFRFTPVCRAPPDLLDGAQLDEPRQTRPEGRRRFGSHFRTCDSEMRPA